MEDGRDDECSKRPLMLMPPTLSSTVCRCASRMTTEEREFLAMWRLLDAEQQECMALLLRRISDRYEDALNSPAGGCASTAASSRQP
jgi:hypothetical protein